MKYTNFSFLLAWLTKKWNDAVWSKVIAAGIIFIFGSAAFYITKLSSDYLNRTTEVSNALIFFSLILNTSTIIWFSYSLFRSIRAKYRVYHKQDLVDMQLIDVLFECVTPLSFELIHKITEIDKPELDFRLNALQKAGLVTTNPFIGYESMSSREWYVTERGKSEAYRRQKALASKVP